LIMIKEEQSCGLCRRLKFAALLRGGHKRTKKREHKITLEAYEDRIYNITIYISISIS
jgi:hypothetical protein